jgi:hypothetical protein
MESDRIKRLLVAGALLTTAVGGAACSGDAGVETIEPRSPGTEQPAETEDMQTESPVSGTEGAEGETTESTADQDAEQGLGFEPWAEHIPLEVKMNFVKEVDGAASSLAERIGVDRDVVIALAARRGAFGHDDTNEHVNLGNNVWPIGAGPSATNFYQFGSFKGFKYETLGEGVGDLERWLTDEDTGEWRHDSFAIFAAMDKSALSSADQVTAFFYALDGVGFWGDIEDWGDVVLAETRDQVRPEVEWLQIQRARQEQ